MNILISRFLYVLLIANSFLYADEFYSYMKMTCDPSDNTVYLECDAQDNNPPKIAYTFKEKIFGENDFDPEQLKIYKDGECRFANGRIVRIRLGADVSRSYGQCGASPAEWFSLWVNKKKVLSKTIHTPQCYSGRCTLKSLKVSDKNIAIYQYHTSNEFPVDVNWSVVNTKIMKIDDGLPIDEIEYPSQGKKNPVGTRVLSYGHDNPICSEFIKKDWYKRIKHVASEKYMKNARMGFKRISKDLNHDGIKEYIYKKYQAWGPYDPRFYILDEKSAAKIDALLFHHSYGDILNELEATCDYSLPHSWANPDNQSYMTLNSISKTIQLPHEFNLVEYEEETYFQFSSDGVYGLLKYKTADSFEDICLYSKVEENY